MASTRAPYWDKVTLDQLKKAKAFCGYPFFTSGDYNLNLFGIRTNEHTADTFNDVIGVAYKEKGEWKFEKWEATVDPGQYFLKHPMVKAGTAIIVPSHYVGAYRIGLHKGQYEALRQCTLLKYFRDFNKDGYRDWGGKIYEECGYTNIHRASPTGTSTYISSDHNAWSGGCLVHSSIKNFNRMMELARKARAIWGDRFSFTLFNEKSFFCEKKEPYEEVYKGKYVGG